MNDVVGVRAINSAIRGKTVITAAFTFSSYFTFASAAPPVAGNIVQYAPVDDVEVARLLQQMTLREKLDEVGIPAPLVEGDLTEMRFNLLDLSRVAPWPNAENWFDLKENTRLGLRGFRTRDGPRGPTCLLGGTFPFGQPCPEDGSTPSFPHENLRGTTWDVELEEEFGVASGEIGKLLDLHVELQPCINILPWLNAGRGQESYGEDPLFNGRMGGAVVRGIQSQGAMATPKHFLANNIERTRWYVSADMNDKTLHEVYLKNWATLVAESAPEFIMTSYNRVQGNWSNMDPKFIGLLREKLGFHGSVMTDWGATVQMTVASLAENSPFKDRKDDYFGDVSSSLTAGVDMEMPFPNRHTQAVRQLARCGSTDQNMCHTANMLDRNVAHLVRSKLRYGVTGTRPAAHRATFDNERYAALSLKIAEAGMVLLKNEDHILPKRPEDVRSVVVMGTADYLELGDMGSSAQKPSTPTVTVLQGIQETYGHANVYFRNLSHGDWSEKVSKADMVVLDVGTNHTFEGEYVPPAIGGDRRYLHLHSYEQDLIRLVVARSSRVVVVMSSGQNIIVEDFVDKVQGILWIAYPGSLGGRALANILSGKVNPSGRMTSATPKSPADWVPEYITQQPWNAGANVKYPYAHGFKHMWGAGIQPRFPMGWGLSYTTFAFGAPSLELVPHGSSPGGVLSLRVTVTNTGAIRGVETVQVYGTCTTCTQPRLPILLLGFGKARVEAGESAEVTVSVAAKELAIYDEPTELWLLEKGTYQLLVGPYVDVAALQSVDFHVHEDLRFDYTTAAKRPHVSGVGERDCSAYVCVKDEAFNQEEDKAIMTARVVNAIIFIICLSVSCICLRIFRPCIRRVWACCRFCFISPTDKVERAAATAAEEAAKKAQ